MSIQNLFHVGAEIVLTEGQENYGKCQVVPNVVPNHLDITADLTI